MVITLWIFNLTRFFNSLRMNTYRRTCKKSAKCVWRDGEANHASDSTQRGRDMALRKLLEAKDCAVRAVLLVITFPRGRSLVGNHLDGEESRGNLLSSVDNAFMGLAATALGNGVRDGRGSQWRYCPALA